LEEKIVDDAGAVDIGMIMGCGFPAFHGGLLRYADNIGIKRIVEDLRGLEKRCESDRFKPCRYLLDLAANNRKFF
jgi:3-hydroxyacyl-CoA dehydrogenase/enoyl-CoA hydratase/3-hydroxybutyryl-CoA epimerase